MMHNGFNWMRMLIVAIAMMIMGCFSPAVNAEVIPMTELTNPNIIEADDTQIYITDDTTVYIYNRKTFKLIKSFGKTGEGPGEFMGSAMSGRAPLDIDVQQDKLLVSSFGKVTLFSKQGVFLTEKKCIDRSRRFIFFGKGFVGNLNKFIGKDRFRTLNIYDEDMNNLKTLMMRPHTLKPGGGYNPLEGPQVYAANKDKLFVCWEPEFKIRVFDLSGNPVKVITRKYRKRIVTQQQKKKIDDALKKNPRTKVLYSYLKPLNFSKYFPAINNLEVVDGKIYAIGRQDFNEPAVCYIFDLDGRFLKQTKIDLKVYDDRLIYPYCIKNGKVYQLLENHDDEGWSIGILEVKG